MVKRGLPVSISENQKRAPICAAFVQEMRTCFPELVVLYVREGDLEMGEKDGAVGAACTVFKDKKK